MHHRILTRDAVVRRSRMLTSHDADDGAAPILLYRPERGLSAMPQHTRPGGGSELDAANGADDILMAFSTD